MSAFFSVSPFREAGSTPFKTGILRSCSYQLILVSKRRDNDQKHYVVAVLAKDIGHEDAVTLS